MKTNEQWKRLNEMLNTAETIVDLGCGTSPYYKATVAVDKYIEPVHRKWGSNKTINIKEIESKGIKFVNADFEKLPFDNDEFDVAYSHHVVEHLDNPTAAMREMQRIAKRGCIICPGLMAEYMFGRIYHKWLVTDRGVYWFFLRKIGIPLILGMGQK